MRALSVAGVVILAGFMRGITGFGGSMLMASPLSLLLGPVEAVVIALTLEAAAGLVLFPQAWPTARKTLLAYLIAPTLFTAPIGRP
jgi:uncharacterized membrane protein YfcA